MTQTLTPEILVIGAGPGGAAAAWGLAQAGHDVLMIDRAEFPRDKTCGDGLTPMAVGTLREMGVLAQVERAGAVRIDNVRIVGPFGMEATMRFADFQPESPYALVFPRLQFDDLLRRYAIGGGAEHLGGIKVQTLEREGDRLVSVRGASPGGEVEIRARHVVIAVGANMALLQRAGFITHKPRYIRAARAYYDQVPAVDSRYDFFFDAQLLPGYGWVFPVGAGRANVGVGILPVPWSTRRPTNRLLEEFVTRRRQEGVLRGAAQAGPIKGYPLRIDYPATRTAGENWVIVGESAGLVNPVTGEGIDLAIKSGMIAAETLDRDIRTGRPNHRAYQHVLWDRFGPMFTGLRALRDVLITPFFTDYALLLMRQHRYLTRSVMNMAQGFWPPESVFHPLFIVQFFMPVTPRLVGEAVRALRGSGGNER
jgi:geranylgeranyl reductase family protein